MGIIAALFIHSAVFSVCEKTLLLKIKMIGDGEMDAELYIKKASLQMAKGEIEKAVDSMKKAIEVGGDIVAAVQARCFLGEYYFVHQNYMLSKENLEWILERAEELETDYDDLLNDEMAKADMLLEMMETFALIK